MRILTTPRLLALHWPDGTTGEYDSLWLLDNAPAHRHPVNGQRLIDLTELPPEPKIASALLEDETVVLHWEDWAVPSRFPLSYLHEHDPARTTTSEPEVTLWSTSPLAAEDFCWSQYARFGDEVRERSAWLKRLSMDGIAFLRSVPLREGAVLDVAKLLGRILETNYGRVFDVKAKAAPANLADSDMGLQLHTDNPYREPVPGFQMLHVLQAAPEGGESLFADGFSLAETLRQTNPAAFHLLRTVPVRFCYSAPDAELSAERPFFLMRPNDKPLAVHYNNRSIAPLRLPYAELREFYVAYRLLAEAVRLPERQLQLILTEGDLVVFDNWRILHGRTGFKARQHARHLQGCYLTRDSVLSSLAVLRREAHKETIA